MSPPPIDGYDRYAIYYAPPAGGALARLGAAWLGRDAETGEDVPPLDLPGLPAPRETLVRDARRYGFHGTLKAPFRLAEGFGAGDLDAAARALAASLAPVAAAPLAVDNLHGFLALRPSAPSPALDGLAAACVTELDLLRAPLSAAELSRRRQGGLDAVEDRNLRTWGYPYVLDRFLFHLTLTVPLSRAEAAAAAPLLAEAFAPSCADDFRVDAICLFGDPGAGAPFRLLRRYPLLG